MLRLWVCSIFFSCVLPLLIYRGQEGPLLLILFTGVVDPLVGKDNSEGSLPFGRAYRAQVNCPKSQREPSCLLCSQGGWNREAKGMPVLSPIWHFPKSNWANQLCSELAGCCFAGKPVHGERWIKISGESLSSCTGNNAMFACLQHPHLSRAARLF